MDIKGYGFDYRMAEVMPMLGEMHLYGTRALIRDLKTVVDEIQEIRAKAIDEFFQELQKYEEDDMWLRLKMSSIYEIAEQLKEGGVNE